MPSNPKRNNSAQRAATNKAIDEYTTNKILAIFMLTFAIIFLLILAYRGYSHMGSYLISYYGSYITAAASGAAAAVLGIFAAVRRRKDSAPRYKVFTCGNLAVAFALLAVSALVSGMYGVEGIRLMYAVVPSAAALMLITIIYPSDFFFIALVSGCGILLMYIYSRMISELLLWQRNFSLLSFGATLFALICIAVWCVMLAMLRRGGGELRLGKAALSLYPKRASYFCSFLTAGVVALCTLAAYVFGSVAAYYMMFLLLAYVFAMAVVYTVKML